MQVSDVAIKFYLPEVAPPFTNIYRLTPKAGLRNRNPQHYHPDTYEIFAVFHGHQTWSVAGELHALHPGEVILIPPGVVHGSIYSNLQASEVIGLHLAPEQLPVQTQGSLVNVGVSRFRDPFVLDVVRRIFEEQKLRHTLTAETVAALGTVLVSSLIKLSGSMEQAAPGRIVHRAQRLLTRPQGPRPTVSQVAEELGVSTVWLTKRFVEETGMAPGDWARLQRLDLAKRMLETGHHPVAVIAFELGYSSAQVFATAFRKETGLTPSDYRDAHRSPTPEAEPICQPMRIVYLDADEVIGDDQ